MRKITLIGIAVATAMGFTACQKEIPANEQNYGSLVRETFSASLEQPATKTATADGGATVTWAASDKVHYYTADAGTVRNFTITAAGASATLDLEREASDTYYNLVYAGSTTPAFTTNTSSSMVFDGVKAAQDGTFANANVSVASTAPGGTSVTFKPATAIVKFTTARTDIKTIVLTGGAGTENVAGNISVDPTASTPTATLSGTGSTSITATIATPAAGTYYINVLPGTYSSGLKLTLKDAGSNIIGTVTASSSIDLSAGGKMINLGDIDSHIVVPATDLSSAGTANCYIVSAAGTYKFKTVKGNSTTSVGDVKGVKVLWESYGTNETINVGDIIKADVSYADNYITFSTNDTFKEGNAVIAAYSDAGCTDGNVLWSWHLWLTDTPANQVYNNSAGTMMDRNLGATSATMGDVGALGLLYQWGRKDPFLGSSSDPSTEEAASTLTWPAAVAAQGNSSENAKNLNYSIANPATFITNDSSPYDWYCTSATYKNDNLWGSTKTIYDPCPVGYRVPDGGSGGIWDTAGFPSSSYTFDSSNMGMDFSSFITSTAICWYPASGYRHCDSGLLDYVFNLGSFWSCTPYNFYAYCLSLDDMNYVNPSFDYYRAYGLSVRCLSE